VEVQQQHRDKLLTGKNLRSSRITALYLFEYHATIGPESETSELLQQYHTIMARTAHTSPT
jgi:hypothetical protein